jgi:hypothetical protein
MNDLPASERGASPFVLVKRWRHQDNGAADEAMSCGTEIR